MELNLQPFIESQVIGVHIYTKSDEEQYLLDLYGKGVITREEARSMLRDADSRTGKIFGDYRNYALVRGAESETVCIPTPKLPDVVTETVGLPDTQHIPLLWRGICAYRRFVWGCLKTLAFCARPFFRKF